MGLAAGLTITGGTAYADDKKQEGTVKTAPREDEVKPKSPPVKVGVIGLGAQGQEIVRSLKRMGTGAPVVALCDTFTKASFVKKSTDLLENPSVMFESDYRKLLDDKNIQAVVIATPSHKHKQIALDALQAGKHVYLEMPLASNLEEAKAIAQAGLAAKTVFHPGLQMRSNMQYHHVLHFVNGKEAVGQITMVRSQFHQKTSWKRAWPTDERQAELNWRLKQETSLGLLGEVGIHSLDVANWFLHDLPVAISGQGRIAVYKEDGRDIQDVVQVTVEYDHKEFGHVRMIYDATLTNSFDGQYDAFYGTNSAVQMRDQRAWMFKESDALSLGWETFARKDVYSIGKPENGSGLKMGEGIALVADASKQIAAGKQPGAVGTDVSKTSLYQSLDNFLDVVRGAVKPWVGALEGYQATVMAAKANEACLKNTRLELSKDMFTLS